MVDVTDGELSILINACTKIKAALNKDKSPLAQNIMKGITESELIIKSKMSYAASFRWWYLLSVQKLKTCLKCST